MPETDSARKRASPYRRAFAPNKMNMSNTQMFYILLPSSIALALIIPGSNFKQVNKDILGKFMKRVFITVAIIFFIVWFVGSQGFLMSIFPYSDKLSGNYIFSGIMLIGYITVVTQKGGAI